MQREEGASSRTNRKAAALARLVRALEDVLLGKPDRVRLALSAYVAGGHLLIEDRPGVGKTTLAKAIAQALGLEFKRVQATSDMLPADILGAGVWDPGAGSFRFVEGPVFTNVLLVDEINRAGPRTQSALLEAMEEGQVSAEGETRPLPEPFFVIATQNPLEHHGTFPLPDSQLDRFLLCMDLGYPDRSAELALLGGRGGSRGLDGPVLGREEALALRGAAAGVRASEGLIEYVQALAEHTRRDPCWVSGLSPRAALSLLAAARAWALMEGRDFTLPEDVQAVFPFVAVHRLRPKGGAGERDPEALRKVLEEVPVP